MPASSLNAIPKSGSLRWATDRMTKLNERRERKTVRDVKATTMKITLITCTYNAAEVLQRTLDSVLCQTYADIEHIIVDGKSKDATLSMAEAYRRQSDASHVGHQIVIKSEPDKGLYDAMNKGIAMATGDYLCFLNAGDVLPASDTIARIAQSVQGGTYSVLYGETDIVDDNGRFLRHRRLQAPDHLTWRSFRQGMLVCHQAFYANTQIAKRVPYDLRYRISGDVDWCIRVMKEGDSQHLDTHNVRFVVANYLAGGMSVKNHRASLKERFVTMCRHYGLIDTVCLHLWFVLRAVLKR